MLVRKCSSLLIIALAAIFLSGMANRARGQGASDSLKQLQKEFKEHKAAGRLHEAEKVARRALSLAEKGSNKGLLITWLENLAALYRQQARYPDSERLFRRALKLDEELSGPNHKYVAVTLTNLANVIRNQGRYAEAEPLYQRSFKIGEKVLGPEHPVVAATLNNLGTLYETQGRYAEAEPLYQRSLKIKEKVHGPEHSSVAGTLNNLANLYNRQGRYAEAEPLYQRSMQIEEKVLGPDHPKTASTLNNLALLYVEQGRYAEAEPLLQSSLANYEKAHGPEHPNVARSLQGLATLFSRQGRYAEAEPLIDRAISIRDRAGVAPRDRFLSYWVRAWLAWKQGRKREAVEDLRHSLQLAEQQRGQVSGAEQEQAKSFAEFASAFETMVAWQTELGDLSEALSAAERSRARSLQDQMALRGVDLLAGLPPNQAAPLRDRETRAKVQVGSLEKQINFLPQQRDFSEAQKKSQGETLREELKQAREKLIDAYIAIRNASPAYRLAVASDRKPVSLEKLQAWVAESDGLLLEYFLGEKAGFLFIVPTEGEAELVTLSVSEEQAEKLGIEAGPLTAERIKPAFSNEEKTGVLDLLHNPTRAEEAVPKLAVLWQLLIPTEIRDTIIEGELKKLIVVPDGPLALLPFETLVVADDQAPTYLLDVAPPIIHGPSATILYNLAQLSEANGNGKEPVLTIGDPAYPNTGTSSSRSEGALAQLTAGTRYSTVGGQLARLLYSGTESNWVASVFERDGEIKSKRLTGNQATESNLRTNSTGRRWVHLACHGQADQKYGNFFGALALAPGRGAGSPADDGFLTLPEIYELNLNGCELSILSACQTNYGPQQKGEGVWALSRGFLVAGSKRVVASNWLVDDKAAASLISYFCSGVAQAEKKNEPPDYAQKLHAAKKWVRNQEQWQSPFYWGTFVLVGPN